MFTRFFAVLRTEGSDQIESLRFVLMSVIVTSVLSVVAILKIKPSVGVSVCITFLPWIFIGFRLFSISRFVGTHVIGEGIEFFSSLTKIFKGVKNDFEETGALDNEFIRIYWSVVSGIFLAQTVLFLILPLYVNYTDGGFTTGIIMAMLVAIVLISSATFFMKIFRMAVVMTVVAYSVGLIFVLFPQTNFYLTGLIGKTNVVAMSTAKKVNELDALQSVQQEKINNDFINGIIVWQKANPGVELPTEYKEALQRARQLGKLKS
jgi:hypothetical protein